MTEQQRKKSKIVQMKIRIEDNLLVTLQEEAIKANLSMNQYINFILRSYNKKEVLFSEKINKIEKKEIESRIYLTIGEMKILKEHAMSNGWSIPKEVRYRVISSLSRKPKLDKEELKAIYATRSSINVLGANINRLVRDNQPLSDNNIKIRRELIELIEELKTKVNYLTRCNDSSFILKQK